MASKDQRDCPHGEGPDVAARDDEELLELRFVVPPDRDRWRLDRFLRDRIPRLSRTRLQRIIEREIQGPDGQPPKPSRRVRAGETIVLFRPPPQEPDTPQEFGVLFEDDQLFIVDKPSGLPVHPSARYHRNTLTWLLREAYGPQRPIITHRLDRETSGLLVCAKTKAAERHLKLQFEGRTVGKEYLAVVRGDPDFDRRLVDLPLGPARDSRVRIRMGPRHDGEGLPAQTELRVLERFGKCALVAARPLTGRQHQIRAHLAALGHSVVGDKIYGVDEQLFIDYVQRELTPEEWDCLELPRHALHAHRIELTHPASSEPFVATSPLPPDLRQYLKRHGR